MSLVFYEEFYFTDPLTSIGGLPCCPTEKVLNCLCVYSKYDISIPAFGADPCAGCASSSPITSR